jgi:hypothetical protein
MTEHEGAFLVGGHTVRVSKVGGGTIGREYTGHWDVRIENRDGDVVWETVPCLIDKVYTSTPTQHSGAAFLSVHHYEESL